MAGGARPNSLSEESLYVELRDSPLDVLSTMDRVRSPKAGAIVFFAGAKFISLDFMWK